MELSQPQNNVDFMVIYPFQELKHTIEMATFYHLKVDLFDQTQHYHDFIHLFHITFLSKCIEFETLSIS